jgi:hypothetical protein
MRNPLRQVAKRPRRSEPRKRATFRTLVLLLPRFRNPDAAGSRRKFELNKWKTTLRETEEIFPGYQRFPVKGWNPVDHVRDDLYRFETDLFVTPAIAKMIHRWKLVLKRRFEQRDVYVRISNKVSWL